MKSKDYISKDYRIKTKDEIDNDIINSYTHLIKDPGNKSIIKIDLTKTNDKSIEEYNFRLRTLFNKIRKKFNDKEIDYLFVIEVPKEISNTKYMISTKEIKYHSHIVLKTNISVIDLLKSFKCFFDELKTYHIYEPYKMIKDPDLYLEIINNRNDVKTYYNYLIKQHTISNFSYQYKIKKSE
jgi:hypothetical protein